MVIYYQKTAYWFLQNWKIAVGVAIALGRYWRLCNGINVYWFL